VSGKSFLAVVTAFLVCIGFAVPVSASPIFTASFSKDSSKQAIYWLGACQSPKELDCIESFGVLDSATGRDVFSAGSETSFDSLARGKDDRGNEIFGSESTWNVNSASGSLQYSVSAYLESPRHIWDSATKSRAGALRVFINGNEEDFSTRVQLKIRTSWLKPLNMAIYASEADWSTKKIPGGSLWTFSGVRTKTAGYYSDWNSKLAAGAAADYDGSALYFLVDHAGKPGESYYNPTCSDKGFTAEASNATAAGQPFWNSSTRSLEFNIYAPHTDTQGNLNRGFFKLWVNRAYMKCKWPESNLHRSPSFRVSVYNENGTKQKATTVIAVIRGQLRVNAYNFHYSKPTIRIQASKTSVLSCQSRTNPEITRTIRGTKPQCPKGFRVSR
jgi:hypothetical protein